MPFTVQEAEAAGDAWGFNCGPAAICALLCMKPAEIRPYLCDFEATRRTNPTLMMAILDGLRVRFHVLYKDDYGRGSARWPKHGLVRVQFAGPWTQPGVPIAARYRKTHLIAVRTNLERLATFGHRPADASVLDIFDINAIDDGGWLSWTSWTQQLVPWMVRKVYVGKASGEWWPTHCLEVDLRNWEGPCR